MVNAYDFSDDEQSNDLSDIGKKLSEVNKSKDSLIKLLKVKITVPGLDLRTCDWTICVLCCSELAKPLRKHLKQMLVPRQPQRQLQRQL